MDKEAAILRRDLGRVETGRGKRYPAELRVRVVTWARGRRAAGASWEEIKRELGQQFDTVRRWCVDGGDTSRRKPFGNRCSRSPNARRPRRRRCSSTR